MSAVRDAGDVAGLLELRLEQRDRTGRLFFTTRAEEIAREHARLALQNLDLVLEDHVALDRLEGAPLLRVV